jgi:hypothetical protein
MPNRLIISPTKQVIEERPQIIRIAMHPRDPPEAIKDQKQMITILKIVLMRYQHVQS